MRDVVDAADFREHFLTVLTVKFCRAVHHRRSVLYKSKEEVRGSWGRSEKEIQEEVKGSRRKSFVQISIVASSSMTFYMTFVICGVISVDFRRN